MLLCLRVRGWHRLPSRVVAALVWVVREIVPLVKIYPPARDASQWFHYLQTPPPLLSRGRGRGRVHWPCLDYILFVSLHVITVTVGFWRFGREQQTDCATSLAPPAPPHVLLVACGRELHLAFARVCFLGFSCQARVGCAQHLDPRPRARVLHGAKWCSEVPACLRPFCCFFVDLMSLKY